MSERGKYIVIEGSDGTGKSTQVKLLIELLKQKGIESVEFHEPAGTPIASKIREIIIDGTLPRSPKTNLLLYTAARHEIWQEASAALASGKWVIASRNYLSTLAYQGSAEGIDKTDILRLTEEFTDSDYMMPDAKMILTIADPELRAARIASRGNLDSPDIFESRGDEFQQKIIDGYSDVAKEYDIPLVDALGEKTEVLGRIIFEVNSQISDLRL